MLQQPLCHNFRCPQLIASMDKIDAACIFCQEGGLFHRRIAAANDIKGLSSKNGCRAIANRAGSDPFLPKLPFLSTGNVESLGCSSRGDDQSMGLDLRSSAINGKRELCQID